LEGTSGNRQLPAHVWVGVGLTALTLLVYWPLLDLALLGWDSWPMILTARVQDWGDLWGCLTEPLMDGRYPLGEFYRPVTNLFFAIDHSLGGLEPGAYHRTDLLIHLGNTLLIACLAARLCVGRAALWAAGCVGVLYCLHPIQLELITASPRRADTLCLLFTLACLLTQGLPGEGHPRGPRWLGGLLAFLAVGSKETGAVVLPVVFAWHVCLSSQGQVPLERLRSAAKKSLPVLFGVLALLAVRTLVLGGLGGPVPLGGEPVGRLELFGTLIERTVLPLPVLGWSHARLPFYAAGLILMGATWLSLRDVSTRRLPEGAPRMGPVMSFLGLWCLSVFAITGFADQMHEWYALLLSAPVVLTVGQCMVRMRFPLRALACPWLMVFPIVSLVVVLRGWPLESTPRLDAISFLAQQDLTRLEEGVESADDGTVLRLNPWHPMLAPASDGSDVRSLFSAFDYGLQAWCELRWPERTFDVQAWTLEIPQPQPDMLRVQLIPGPEPGYLNLSPD